MAPNVSDGIDKDDPDYREMVKTRRRRPRAPRLSPRPRRRRRRPAAAPSARGCDAIKIEAARTAEDAEREATAAKKIADALAAPPRADPAWMTAKGTDILAAVESVVAKHPKGEAVKKPPSAEKAPPAKDATPQSGGQIRVIRGVRATGGARPHRRRALRQVRHDRPGQARGRRQEPGFGGSNPGGSGSRHQGSAREAREGGGQSESRSRQGQGGRGQTRGTRVREGARRQARRGGEGGEGETSRRGQGRTNTPSSGQG